MPLKDLLKKREKLAENASPAVSSPENRDVPQFTFIRTDTNTQEIINPPSFGDHSPVPTPPSQLTTPPKKLGRLRKSSGASVTSPILEESPTASRRLSQRLHLSRSASTSSVNIPSDLPDISERYDKSTDQQDKEAQWEDRATRLGHQEGGRPGSRGGSAPPPDEDMSRMNLSGPERPSSRSSNKGRSVSDAMGDENIQQAIKLHEAGDLTNATKMFGRLAENGNVLSQVLYGLSLRHGWGCDPDPTLAVTYLRSAASSSADIEADALKAGMKKGGAAKGELVLAIYELAQCFRNGWGVEIDKAAARQYYETAANLGDTDAMNEAAWCFLEGFGGKKDKVSRGRIVRLLLHTACDVGTPQVRYSSSVTLVWASLPQWAYRLYNHNCQKSDEIPSFVQPQTLIQAPRTTARTMSF